MPGNSLAGSKIPSVFGSFSPGKFLINFFRCFTCNKKYCETSKAKWFSSLKEMSALVDIICLFGNCSRKWSGRGKRSFLKKKFFEKPTGIKSKRELGAAFHQKLCQVLCKKCFSSVSGGVHLKSVNWGPVKLCLETVTISKKSALLLNILFIFYQCNIALWPLSSNRKIPKVHTSSLLHTDYQICTYHLLLNRDFDGNNSPYWRSSIYEFELL